MPATASTPEVSIVVASHDRPLRLRWLLNALEEQTAAGRFEVVVGTDSAGEETYEILRNHALAKSGVLRHVELEPGTALPGRNRNHAWRIAKAPLIAFTDDDCRPPVTWIQSVLDAAARHPGAIVQGATTVDPDEFHITAAPFHHSQMIDPPKAWAQCCNILYPRAVLDQVGGFEESMLVGEDTDLAWRALKAGVAYAGDREMLTYHCVEEVSMLGHIRGQQRWGGLQILLQKHPDLRNQFPTGWFWKRTHVWFFPAAVGAVRSFRNPLWLVLTVPYLAHAFPQHGSTPKKRISSLSAFPPQIVQDMAEIVALVRGSIRHRTFFL